MKIDLRRRWLGSLTVATLVALGVPSGVSARPVAELPTEAFPEIAQQIGNPEEEEVLPSGDMPRLTEGMDGTAVMMLQVILRDLDFYNDALDGNFGPRTAEATRAAQKEYDLVQDAVVGPVSWPQLLYHWDNRDDR